ncbi:MAG: TldD/PmbA family protein [Clostridiales bacterium]|nr:TldD/PmbA family protein [Clostridiales bacterium]
MDMNLFIDRVLEAAKAAGIETAEVYYESGESFRASAMDGEINQYQVSASAGLSLRGTVAGKMGYSATQAFDEAAIAQLIEGVKESAALVEAAEQDEIFAGDESYPELPKEESDLKDVTPEQKLEMCLAMEKAAKEADPRVWKVQRAMVMTAANTVRIKNSYGLDLSESGSVCMAYAAPIAKADDKTATGGHMVAGHRFAELDPQAIGQKAVEETVCQLGASPVPAGEYRIIMRYDAMQSLLQTFAGVFSAENAQQNMSLLKGKEGETIASAAVTLMDDPLLPGGVGSQRFDAEGSASMTKAIIDAGVLTTLLHSRKTARKQGVKSTANASRASYASAVRVAPTNLFFKPGQKDLDAMMADVGEGLVITDLAGLHSGANPTSGDFSLLSKGYTIEGGKRGRAVEQITVAGNFYEVLRQIAAVGSDLEFGGSSIGSPSVDVGTLKVSG